ncbi:hypothetical protein GBAR_LOCUS26345 [Geodia barretti]|uniref:Uncharacterized protein n=1 Tax=Geodia barretti TaxID=519541 RepID=A0AA35TIB9_GEOBA|nr:hypothetical protein GBAR_LOCUS26345 [Geodia barretti]
MHRVEVAQVLPAELRGSRDRPRTRCQSDSERSGGTMQTEEHDDRAGLQGQGRVTHEGQRHVWRERGLAERVQGQRPRASNLSNRSLNTASLSTRVTTRTGWRLGSKL